MTSPLPVFPTVVIEASFTPGVPVPGASTLLLDDATFGLLGTGTLAAGNVWTDISAYALNMTITRPSSRVQGPLLAYQAGTASITLDNSDGRFDPDNLAGPYVAGGVSQIQPMVPIRISASFAGTFYPLFYGFADSWTESQVDYEGGYSEWVLSCTDGFKILAGITLAALGSPTGTGAATGARINDILNRAGWYTGTAYRQIAAGDSTLQGTTLGDSALNLMQIAVDSEIGQLYMGPAGAVVFLNRQALLTNPSSVTSQATFGDLPGGTASSLLTGQDTGFEGGTGNWGSPSNCTIASSAVQAHSGVNSLALTSAAAGAMNARSTTTPASSVIQVDPGQLLAVSGWFRAGTVSQSCRLQVNWYDATGTFISTFTPPPVTDNSSGWTQQSYTTTAVAGASSAVIIASMITTAGAGEIHYVDDVTAVLPELPLAAVGRALDDTTIANDVQATRVGGTLQEVSNAASEAKYLFPRTYTRDDLILQTDTDALSWASWVLSVSLSAEDRFDSVSIDPAAQPYDLWPQVLGRDMGHRITAVKRPLNVGAVTRDGFISGITHAADFSAPSWLTTWTLQDAVKYSSFVILGDPVHGKLDANSLAF